MASYAARAGPATGHLGRQRTKPASWHFSAADGYLGRKLHTFLHQVLVHGHVTVAEAVGVVLAQASLRRLHAVAEMAGVQPDYGVCQQSRLHSTRTCCSGASSVRPIRFIVQWTSSLSVRWGCPGSGAVGPGQGQSGRRLETADCRRGSFTGLGRGVLLGRKERVSVVAAVKAYV